MAPCLVCEALVTGNPVFCASCYSKLSNEELGLLRAANLCKKNLFLAVCGSIAYQIRVANWLAAQPKPDYLPRISLTLEDLDL